MAAEEGDWDVLIPVLPGVSRQGGTTVRQTLHAVYRRSCLPAIEDAIAAGRFQVVSFFPFVRVSDFDEERCRLYDQNLRSFFSVNTPEALAEAVSWARSGEG
jgi:molybdopterin-guanine dinucleotide biosynthesis protein A